MTARLEFVDALNTAFSRQRALRFIDVISTLRLCAIELYDRIKMIGVICYHFASICTKVYGEETDKPDAKSEFMK